MDCKECKLYLTCTTLCPYAEAYVNQDYVPPFEIAIDAQEVDLVANDNWVDRITGPIYLTRKEKLVVRLLGLGLSRKDIRHVLEMSSNALEVVIHRLKRKLDKM